MAKPKSNKNVKSTSITFDANVFEALDEHRWSQRKTFSQMLEVAVREYLTNHNIAVPESAPAAQEGESSAPAADEAPKSK